IRQVSSVGVASDCHRCRLVCLLLGTSDEDPVLPMERLRHEEKPLLVYRPTIPLDSQRCTLRLAFATAARRLAVLSDRAPARQSGRGSSSARRRVAVTRSPAEYPPPSSSQTRTPRPAEYAKIAAPPGRRQRTQARDEPSR